jgi:hypothetical protein
MYDDMLITNTSLPVSHSCSDFNFIASSIGYYFRTCVDFFFFLNYLFVGKSKLPERTQYLASLLETCKYDSYIFSSLPLSVWATDGPVSMFCFCIYLKLV